MGRLEYLRLNGRCENRDVDLDVAEAFQFNGGENTIPWESFIGLAAKNLIQGKRSPGGGRLAPNESRCLQSCNEEVWRAL